MVGDIAKGQRAGGQAIVLDGCRRGHDATFQIGVACDLDIETTVTGFQATLTTLLAVGGDAVVLGLDLALRRIDRDRHHLTVADRGNTDAYATANTLLLAVVGELVLQAFDQ